MELAANPAYRGSLYLSSFYRHYILKEDISCPRLPPYLQLNVLSVIEKAFSSGYDVIAFSTKQWYEYLMETDLTREDPESGNIQLIECRAELHHPAVDWAKVWSRSRLKSFNGDMWAFTFKLLHDILPYEERVSNILPNSSPFCCFNCPGPIHADLRHCFFECVASNTVGGWLIGQVRLSDS